MIVVTPNGLGAAGNERRGGTLGEVSHARAAALLRGLEARERHGRRRFAKAAIAAVRQVAQEGGHPLPEKVAPVADASAPPAATAKKKGLSGWVLAGDVAALFFLAWLLFEVVATLRERRAKTAADLPPGE